MYVIVKWFSLLCPCWTLSPHKQVGDKAAFPADWPSHPLRAPDDLETGLTRDEQLIIELHERPIKELSVEERERMDKELESVRKEMIDIAKEKFEYQRDVNRCGFLCL